jgi:alpha-ribazole phosphatase
MAQCLILLRHARVGPDSAGRLIGATDLPLDAAGLAQAHGRAAMVAHLSPQRCFTSPMVRCRQTIAAAVPGVVPCEDPDLREIDFGRWENRRFEEFAAADPDLAARWAAFDPEMSFPGGEKLAGFLARVRTAAHRLVSDPAPTVLAVTHGGVVRMMLCQLLGVPEEHHRMFELGYAALAVVRLYDAGEKGDILLFADGTTHADRHRNAKSRMSPFSLARGVLASLDNLDLETPR